MSSAPENFVALEVDEAGAASIAGDVGIDFSSGDYSLLAWIQYDAFSSNAAIIEREGQLLLRATDNGFFFQITGCPPLIWNSQAPLDDGWHSVCVTFARGSARLFVDGEFQTVASVGTSAATSSKPLVLGSGLQGLLRRVTVFNTALDSDQVMTAQFGDLGASLIAADFDFSTNPPADNGPKKLPISLTPGATSMLVTPALHFESTGYAHPRLDAAVNPGGFHIDPYTVQGWVFVERSTPRQTVFANSDLDSETGISLALVYNSGTNAFALESRRGSRQGGEAVTSNATIAPGVWVNVATTFDGTTLEIYVDGSSAGSKTCGPIPLARNYGDVVLGATFDATSPGGVETLQGYLARLDVWERALSAAEITQFQGQWPSFDATGLSASYQLVLSPCRNLLNGHPVALADGVKLGHQLAPAPTGGEPQVQGRILGQGIDDDQLAEWRAAVDHGASLEKLAPHVELACINDMAELDEASGKEVRAAYREVWRRLQAGGDDTPFTLTEHCVGDRLLWVAHSRRGSWVAFEADRVSVSDCALWKVKLVFIVVAGALDAFCGVSAKLDDKAIPLILRILANPNVSALLSRGSSMSAATIFALLGVIYQAGFLRQLISLIVDLGWWSLARVLVKIVLTALGVGAASVLASLAATVVLFIKTYLERPTSCDPLPTVTLGSIRFDWDPTRASVDGLSLRRDARTPVRDPTWQRGDTQASQSPVAYAIDQVQGKTIYVQASFTLDTRDPTSVQIRATGGGILGAIDPVTVRFLNGVSAPKYQVLELPHHTVGSGGVQAVDAQWTWEYKIGNGNWTPMATSNHRVYALLSTPTGPWRQSNDPNNTQLPWTTALEYTCQWAAGKTTPADVLAAVTTRVNGSLGLKYDTSQGKSFYTGSSPSGLTFLLTSFLELLGGGRALGKTVNCTDCATIVTTFANLAGCNIQASIMLDNSNSGFDCNKIVAIGFTNWAYPFDRGGVGHFAYHEVAWMQGSSYRDAIYDACLQLDSSNDPWNWQGGTQHTPKLPAGMVFTQQTLPTSLPIATPFTDQTYRERLATNNASGIGACKPRGQWPGTQSGRRRVV